MFRRESGQAVAALARAFGDLDRAEEAVQDAFVVAIERWPRDGIPPNPAAWIALTARRKAIDRLRLARRETPAAEIAVLEALDAEPPSPIPDERLELIFACCHPALAPETRVALTLRALGGLSTREVARAFLVSEDAMAQRLQRAKQKLRGAGIRFELPRERDLPARRASVLATLYLIFGEGYAATAGDALIRRELCAEAIHLARVLCSLMPDEPEALGLLALMRLHDSRRDARVDARGELVLLADQDRSRWDRAAIAEGSGLVERALALGGGGPYVLQAFIAAEHARPGGPDWTRVVGAYDRLLAVAGGPVVALNRAVAVAMAQGPQSGLALMDELAGELDGYHLLHSARADLLRRLGRADEAAAAYSRALSLAANPVERAFLAGRLEATTARPRP
ncbi:MAG TPA: sigma-70 family RNA polymerase sigma factor [Solirubrobacteraceae bacterium]|nr:sigma-70 family RNA polymerase sigma factor [Solirubrobacteraceae bacterium]